MNGTTDTPNFQVDAGGLPVPLKTRSGRSWMAPTVTRTSTGGCVFLNTKLTAKGAVIGLEGVPVGRSRSTSIYMKGASRICSGSR